MGRVNKEVLAFGQLGFSDLTQSEQWLSASQRQALSDVISASFSNIDVDEYLAKYFDSPSPYQRKLRLYRNNDKIVGYCLLTFTDIAGCTVIKVSAA